MSGINQLDNTAGVVAGSATVVRRRVCVESPIRRSARVVQCEGMFDLPSNRLSRLVWDVELPLGERPWNIGLIVGPSGSGKTTIARELFGDAIIDGFEWPRDRSVLDAFPGDVSVKEIVELLSAVGFASPPSWLRPFHVLSTGEQFRVTVARALAEKRALTVIDEFTSVVDRTVAQIGSAAVARAIRRRGLRFVAISCHSDITDWLQPEWTYEPALNRFRWRYLQRRPKLELTIRRVGHEAWEIFRAHHYLSGSLSRAAKCLCAFYRDTPVAFAAWLPHFGRVRNRRRVRRCSRLVTLPDYQGVGIGQALLSTCAAAWSAIGMEARITTSHPAMIASLLRSENWKMIRRPSLGARERNNAALARTRAVTRLTAGFAYIGPSLDADTAGRLLTEFVGVEQGSGD